MAWATWRQQKSQLCERVDKMVSLEVKVVYPEDIMPDQPPRILGHRCSEAINCNLIDKPSCRWAGTSSFDPFNVAV
jgi:hypothetical protein